MTKIRTQRDWALKKVYFKTKIVKFTNFKYFLKVQNNSDCKKSEPFLIELF